MHARQNGTESALQLVEIRTGNFFQRGKKVDQTSFNEFRINAFEILEFTQNDDSITAQRRRSYLMEMNEDFDIQQVFNQVTWNQKSTE